MDTIRVVRVGGSLLTWSGLKPALEGFLADQASGRNVFTTGGGPWVELIRQRANRLELSEREAHWLCIRALGLTSEFLSLAMQWPLVTAWTEIASVPDTQCVLDTEAFLRDHERHLPGTILEETWDVTSDSVAARVAEVLGASELILLKSAPPPAHSDLAELSAKGYVDAFFPRAAQALPKVRFINLRPYLARSS